MSLEETITKNTLTMEALTDAVQQLCSLIRQAPPAIVAQPAAGASSENPTPAGKPRGRPPKAAPPSPMDVANSAATSKPDLSAATSTDASPDGAPAADDGSEVKAEPVVDYPTLKALVLELGAAQGNTAVLGLLAQLGGYKSALEIKENPAKIAEAIPLFRAALGQGALA